MGHPAVPVRAQPPGAYPVVLRGELGRALLAVRAASGAYQKLAEHRGAAGRAQLRQGAAQEGRRAVPGRLLARADVLELLLADPG